ncbi:MAG TPA: peptidyl-prolyl cis-trans isomerase [Polyangia bacterium]|nr:peptidyl-prolyl cis-trans isomerase [Polyangia bacterium]
MPDWKRRLYAEPTVWFFVVGALLFGAHRLVVGDGRVIVLTAGSRAELARQFQDANGRAPTPVEMEKEIRAWERDEALSREALRAGLERNDRNVRTVLADKVRARVALGIPTREPTAAELDAWLAAHRSLYTSPARYDYGTIAFPKADSSSSAELGRFERALAAGADARTLGRDIIGADLGDADLKERVGPELAARIEALPVGKWQRLERPDGVLLARLNAVEGGLPPPDVLRPRLLADWQLAERRREVDRAVQALVDKYRLEERGR